MQRRTNILVRIGRGLCLGLVLTVGATVPRTIAAQQPLANQTPTRDLQYIGTNMLVGGVMAGVASAIRGRPVVKGFAQGALGGAVSYLGKRATSEDIPAAGILGRQIGALGASIIRSATFGSGLLVDTLIVPLGPLRGYVTLLDIGQTRVRVDLEEVGWLVYNLTQDDLTFDAGASLSSGSFVFTSEVGLRGARDRASGRAAPGVIALRLDGEGNIPEDVLAHERVHINQFDQLKITAGLPLEGLARRGFSPGSRRILDWIDFGVGHWPFQWTITGGWLPRERQLFEIEAEYFETR